MVELVMFADFVVEVRDPNLIARAIQGFHLGGGGGAKDYVRPRTSRARTPKSLTAGVQGPLIEGPWKLSGDLWCSLVLSEPYF